MTGVAELFSCPLPIAIRQFIQKTQIDSCDVTGTETRGKSCILLCMGLTFSSRSNLNCSMIV